jgi:hypothetical protein
MRSSAAACLAMACGVLVASAAGAEKIAFVKTQLDTAFRSEGVCVGDFNGDGRLDIAAGSVYYAAPDWKMHVFDSEARQFDPRQYSNSFCNFADDLNGDGRTDILVVDWPGKQTWWFEQPAQPSGAWKRYTCIEETNNESPAYLDLDGDGRRELLCASGDRYVIARRGDDPRKPWNLQILSESVPQWTGRYYHGLGAGDINGDGLADVMIPHGYWTAPREKSPGVWAFHPWNIQEKCAQMYAWDFDGDGDQDVLCSSAHAVGIWWYEQTPGGWVRHTIDDRFSQTHALCLADINGDGLPDFVTGKRWWAHGPTGDVDPNAPAVLYWYELQRRDGTAHWTAHQIDDDSGVGTQFEVTDVNGDGLLDVAIANKKGVYYFEQRRQP